MPVDAQGTVLHGRYRVVGRLGSGGMAAVLLCRDERLGRLVAVKRLHSDQPEDVERRFVREAQLGASLNHPHLVAVFDTVVDDEGILIVMEYVEGESLGEALHGGPLRWPRVGRIAAELGAALDHAHGQGVVHRDVKPANVLLRTDGLTKLVDLGIATAADRTQITGTGTVLGTPVYMAPEQLAGREAGAPADVYSFACVCFEALTGRRARSGGTAIEIAHRIATEPPPDLRQELPEAPREVAELLRRAMARDPASRPRSAGELGRRLRRALEERAPAGMAATQRLGRPAAAPDPPVKSPVPALRYEGTGRRRRPRRLGVVLAAALLVLAAGTVGLILTAGGDPSGADRERPRPERPAATQRDQPRANERAQAQEPAPAPAETPEPEAAPPPEAAPEPTPAPAPETEAPADGASLNDQGFALMNAGRYDEAITILQRAVESYPPGTTDLSYAYALFNLGRSLRLAGRPAEAVPILERRLEIPNQRGTVRRELALARQEAGQG